MKKQTNLVVKSNIRQSHVHEPLKHGQFQVEVLSKIIYGSTWLQLKGKRNITFFLFVLTLFFLEVHTHTHTKCNMCIHKLIRFYLSICNLLVRLVKLCAFMQTQICKKTECDCASIVCGRGVEARQNFSKSVKQCVLLSPTQNLQLIEHHNNAKAYFTWIV